jgi:stalled ribosome rescue protein Dom34
LNSKKNYKRGYAVAALTGINEKQAATWKVFSNVVKPDKIISLNGSRNDPKAIYNFHEAIVDALRPTIKEGVRSIIVTSASRTNYAEQFLQHIYSHHTWLTQGPSKASFSEMKGTATSPVEVTVFTRNSEFRKIIAQTTAAETENILELLEQRLNASTPNPLVLYSLKESEDKIYDSWKPGKPKPEYLLLTDKYLSSNRQKNRLHRLMQIASNKQVKTRIVKLDSPAGKRITQLGGIILVQKLDYQ